MPSFFFKKITTSTVVSFAHINWALADQVMVSGVNFLTGILFARYFGLEEYGRFALAWMSILFFMSIQLTGIIAPMMTYGAKLEEEDSSYFGAVITQQLIWSILCFLLLSGGITISEYIVPHWNIQNIKWPLATVLVTYQLQDFLRRYFFVRNKSGLAFFNDSISYLGQLGMLFILFYYFKKQSIVEVLWLIAVTSGGAVFIGIFAIGSISFTYSSFCKVLKKHWKHAKWLIASSLVQWTSGNFFIVTLGAIVGEGAVGAIRAAQNIMGVTHILFLGMENVIPLGAAKHFKQGGTTALMTYVSRSIWVCSGMTVFFCLFIVINPSWILTFFFGDSFKEYGYLLWWYIPIYLFISLGLPLRAGLRTIESVRSIFIANLLATIFTLISAVYLVQTYQLLGAVVGILVTQVITQFYLLYSFSKSKKYSY